MRGAVARRTSIALAVLLAGTVLCDLWLGQSGCWLLSSGSGSGTSSNSSCHRLASGSSSFTVVASPREDVDDDDAVAAASSNTKAVTSMMNPYHGSNIIKLLRRRREEQHGVWIGNVWIPPQGWKLWSPVELRSFYSNMSVLWLGDSTARRSATTMYAVLNATTTHEHEHQQEQHVSRRDVDDASVIDVNKRSQTEFCNRWINETYHPFLCRPMPGGSNNNNNTRSNSNNNTRSNNSFVLTSLACIVDLEQFLKAEISGTSNITNEMDTIIISMGIWESVRTRDCRKSAAIYDKNNTISPIRNLTQIVTDTIYLLEQMVVQSKSNKTKTIIWRTSGWFMDRENDIIIENMNKNVMDHIDSIEANANKTTTTNTNSNSLLTYVDWGGAIKPRSFHDQRIKGDLKPHYGLEPRLVLMQMITNQLASLRQRQQQQ